MVYIFTDTELLEQKNRTSDTVLDVIFSTQTAEVIDQLTDTHEVLEQEKPLVAEEVLYVLLKLTSVPEMAERLVERIDISHEHAQELVNDLSEELFANLDVLTKKDTPGDPEQQTRSGETAQSQKRKGLSEEERRTIQETSFLPHSVQEEIREPKPEQSETAAEEYNKPETESEVEEGETPSATPSYAKPLTDIPRYDNTYEDPYHEKPD